MRVHFLSVLTLAITLFSGVSELRAAESGPTRKLPPKVDVYELDISLDTDKHTLEVRRMILHYRNVGDQSLDEIVLRLDLNLSWAGATEILCRDVGAAARGSFDTRLDTQSPHA